MKKINILTFLIVIVFSRCVDINTQIKQTMNAIQGDLIVSVKKMEDLLSSYLANPQQFILSHSNKENFIAIFSNFTRLNGEVLYDEYLESKHHKDIQSQLDDLNNFKIRNVNNWEFDSTRGKLVLSDEIRNYPDYYKWQMIVSIMKSMNKIPAIRKNENLFIKNKNLRSSMSLVFPDEVKIMDPPL
jgi:hypothetical protein